MPYQLNPKGSKARGSSTITTCILVGGSSKYYKPPRDDSTITTRILVGGSSEYYKPSWDKLTIRHMIVRKLYSDEPQMNDCTPQRSPSPSRGAPSPSYRGRDDSSRDRIAYRHVTPVWEPYGSKPQEGGMPPHRYSAPNPSMPSSTGEDMYDGWEHPTSSRKAHVQVPRHRYLVQQIPTSNPGDTRVVEIKVSRIDDGKPTSDYQPVEMAIECEHKEDVKNVKAILNGSDSMLIEYISSEEYREYIISSADDARDMLTPLSCKKNPNDVSLLTLHALLCLLRHVIKELWSANFEYNKKHVRAFTYIVCKHVEQIHRDILDFTRADDDSKQQLCLEAIKTDLDLLLSDFDNARYILQEANQKGRGATDELPGYFKYIYKFELLSHWVTITLQPGNVLKIEYT